MYDIKLQNLTTGEYFVKTINSPYLFEKYVKKIKYSKKVRIVSYICYN